MKFNRERNLKNNVFSTKIIRVEDECEESVLKEEQLEDDFGPVEVQVGGTFCACIQKDPMGLMTVKPIANPKGRETVNFKFHLPAKKIKLTMGTEINFVCDSSKETDREFDDYQLSAKKIAEYKCTTFETAILSRIEAAVEAWKANLTEFETAELEPSHFDLTTEE